MILWGSLLLLALYFYFFHADSFHALIENALGVHLWLAYLIFFLLGAFRGFTFIPSTYLILLGFFFFDPLPLYLLTVSGIVVSAATIYYFSDLMNLDAFFEKRYPQQIHKLKVVLEKRELPVIIGWSFAPFLPTDLICYVCGSLELNFRKFILGIFIGEALICIPYIWAGHALVSLCISGSWCIF